MKHPQRLQRLEIQGLSHEPFKCDSVPLVMLFPSTWKQLQLEKLHNMETVEAIQFLWQDAVFLTAGPTSSEEI